MDRRKASIIIGAALSAAAAGSTPARAQTFQTYHCADGTQFIVAFYPYDKRAHLQIDGRPLTLTRRFGLSGAHYSGSGVTLKIARDSTTVRHAGRPTTVCGLT